MMNVLTNGNEKEMNLNVEGEDVKMMNNVELRMVLAEVKMIETEYVLTAKETIEDEVLISELLIAIKEVKVEFVTSIEGVDVKMMNYNEKVNGIKEQLTKGILTEKMIHFIFDQTTKEDYKELKQLVLEAFIKKGRKNFKNQAAIKLFSKDLELVALRRISYDIEEDKENNTSTPKLYVEVQPVQDEEILKWIKDSAIKTVADRKMSLTCKSTNEICTISLGNEILSKSSESRGQLKNLFLMLIGAKEDKITIVVNKSGLAKVYMDKNFELMKGQVAYEYELIGITPSGLRSASIVLASVSRQAYGRQKVNTDRRVELLDNSSDGAFAMCFLKGHYEDGKFIKELDKNGDYIFNTVDSLEDLFKYMGRALMQATASTRIGKLRNYCVFENIAQTAGYIEDKNDKNKTCYNVIAKPEDENFIDCQNTQDGSSRISAEKMKEELNKKGIPCTINDVLGMCFQGRGGATKMAPRVKRRKALVTTFNYLVKRGNKLLRVVLDGEYVEVESLLKDKVLLNRFLDNIEGIFDTNSMKLLNHNPEFELVMLKKAYASETKLNMVINIAMLFQNKKKASELLLRKGKNFINEKIKNDLGLDIDFNANGSINGVKINFERMQGLNNDGQTSVWASKNNPKEMTAIAPGIKKSDLKNATTSIANGINRLRIEVDSKYLVVQSDEAPMFGLRLLNDDEVYCPDLNGVEEVSAARHPISGPYAITTFKVVSPITLLKRINKFKCDLALKQMFIDDLAALNGYALIPASHYLMEKHDGMDFDIDAMQFFKDKEVVDILKEIKDIGTKIDRKADENHKSGNISINFSADEEAIKTFKNSIMNGKSKLIRPMTSKIKTVSKQVVKFMDEALVITQTQSKGETVVSCVPKNADGTYSMSFEAIGCLILDYFLNPIDPVGFISTGFYNNALLYLTMIDEDTSIKDKELIANIISKTFDCSGQSHYSSPIIDKDTFNSDRAEIILTKEICTEVMMRYAESSGSVEDTTAFLLDTCLANRYPAESSIDAAKKMYKIVDMYNLGLVIKALGSDKNMQTRVYDYDEEAKKPVEESNCLFVYNIERFNQGFEAAGLDCRYSTNNFFNIPLLINDTKNNVDISGMTMDEAEILRMESKVPGVADPLYIIRQKLLAYANSLIVYIAKELELYVKSSEAQAIRDKYTTKYSSKFATDSYFQIHKTINRALNCYITITRDLEQQEAIAKNNDAIEIEELTVKKYIKTKALLGCRNYAKLGFMSSATPLTKEEIGCAVFYNMISAFDKNTDTCVTTNTAMLDMFLPEIIAFMNQEGLNTKCGEKILYALNENGKHIKLDDLVGTTISAFKGHGGNEDETIEVVFENKKATFNDAEVIKNEYGYYCVFEKQTLEESDEAGVYIPVKFDTGIASGIEVNLNDFISINFRKVITLNGETKFNSIVGVTADNTEVIIAELILNAPIAKLLDGREISEDAIRFFKSDKSMCIHLNDASILADIALTAEEDELNFESSFSDSDYYSSPVVDNDIASVEGDESFYTVIVDDKYEQEVATALNDEMPDVE